MGNALFIIWRESAEAMLVVGILYAWLKKHPDVTRGMRYLWGGVAAGIGLALALAAVMFGIARLLSDQGLEYFQLGMMLAAGALIVQMVFWMRRHGRTLKRELEENMQKSASAANWWGLLAVVALTVGRESAETVVFLYGLGGHRTRTAGRSSEFWRSASAPLCSLSGRCSRVARCSPGGRSFALAKSCCCYSLVRSSCRQSTS